jgi:hypothetical protein
MASVDKLHRNVGWPFVPRVEIALRKAPTTSGTSE